jgi:riboflavin synthase
MFTGLIAATGKLVSLTPTEGAQRLCVAAPAEMLLRMHTGDSIAVNGVCLTALHLDPQALDAQTGIFCADLAAETVARTSLTLLAPGTKVNLELPTPAGTPLGGHVVQGHVDGVGHLLALEPIHPEAKDGQTDWRLRITIPAACARYVAEKGSIAIDGISLTVAGVQDFQQADSQQATVVTVAIIPHTYAATNLHTLQPGAPVNLEVDVLAKYAERMTAQREQASSLTLASLIANGY